MKVHPVVKEIMEGRNINISEITDLKLDNLPSPSLIPGIQDFKEFLDECKLWDSKVCIYNDYDMDGTSSGAILYKTLNELDINVVNLTSTRERDGYGLSKAAVDKMKDRGVESIITTDCGITADKEIEYANDLNMSVFVLDHHNREDKPDFKYIDLSVNQGKFRTDKLSAGGLAYFISKYLIGHRADKYLDLAGFSTVADLVSLKDKTNRTLAKYGMRNINNKGIKALMKVKDVDSVDTGTVGFSIAPMINAGGRLANNKISFELFTTEDKNRRKELAKELNKINEKRKEMTKKTVKNVEKEVDLSENIIVYQGDISKGLTGLVAGRLMNEHGKPAIIVNQDGKGSGRSLAPLDLQQELQNHLDIIEYSAGHSKAFGIGIGNNDISLLQERLYKETESINYKTVSYEKELNPAIVDDYFMDSLERLNPFGMNFSKPKLMYNYTSDEIENVKVIGNDNSHLKFFINNIECIAFSMADDKDILESNGKIIYSPEYNDFMGRKSIQLNIKEIIKESDNNDE